MAAQSVLPDGLLLYILAGLETKLLMRCKLLSKQWLRTIEDPGFARLHRCPRQGLLMVDPDPRIGDGLRATARNFFFINFHDADAHGNGRDSEVDVSLQFSAGEDLCSFFVTAVVNSLVCFYYRNVAKLCNIATREIVDLPNSRCAYNFCTYHLGFDSINNLYKLVKICPKYEEEASDAEDFFNDVIICGSFKAVSMECEIFTLGADSSWRSIDPPPSCGLTPRHVCFCSSNGILYWIAKGPRRRGAVFLSFNLITETFGTFIDPQEGNKYSGLYLLRFGPGVAVHQSFDNRIIRTAEYDEETGLWSQIHEYMLPYTLSGCLFEEFGPVGTLPDGKLVIHGKDGIGFGYGSSPHFYLFDKVKGDLERFVIRKASGVYPNPDGMIHCYKEDCVSLKRLLDRAF